MLTKKRLKQAYSLAYSLFAKDAARFAELADLFDGEGMAELDKEWLKIEKRVAK